MLRAVFPITGRQFEFYVCRFEADPPGQMTQDLRLTAMLARMHPAQSVELAYVLQTL
jgi:hypothetical protein